MEAPTEQNRPLRITGPWGITATHHELFCHACGYSLRALTSDRCPECGTRVEHAQAAASAIPWSHRGTLGVSDAYLRTLHVALFHPARLGEAGARPVSFRDAARFRTISVLMAWPVFGILIYAFINSIPNWIYYPLYSLWAPSLTGTPREPPAWLTPILLVATGRSVWLPLTIGVLPALLLATSPPAFLFRRRDRHAGTHYRVIALGYYPASAGLVAMAAAAPVLLLIIWAVGLVDGYGLLLLQPAAAILVPLLTLGLILIWSANTARALGRATHASTSRTVLAAILWPPAVIFGSLLSMGAVIYLMGFLAAMWRSR